MVSQFDSVSYFAFVSSSFSVVKVAPPSMILLVATHFSALMELDSNSERSGSQKSMRFDSTVAFDIAKKDLDVVR